MSDFTKIYPVGAELFHMDGRSDRRRVMTKLIVASRLKITSPLHRRLTL